MTSKLDYDTFGFADNDDLENDEEYSLPVSLAGNYSGDVERDLEAGQRHSLRYLVWDLENGVSLGFGI
jgi:hypothetical protein